MRLRPLSRTAILATVTLLVLAACEPQLTTPDGPAPLRYRDPVFSSVSVTRDIQYGQATTQAGEPMALKMDLYQPAGDQVQARPAIVWIHGGGFSGGSKTSAEIVDEANTFAQKGYVGVSIDYRLAGGCVPVSSTCIQSIADAQHDAQAAVRYLRAHATQLRIDPDRIAAAGSSAGAITALNVAYGSDDVGSSGTPGPSSTVGAAVSLSGFSFVTPSSGEPAALLFHGDRDPIVAYRNALQTVAAARDAGLEAYLTTFPGAGHVPYAQNRTAILDQTSNFLYIELKLAGAAR